MNDKFAVFVLPLPAILVSFEFIKVSVIGTFWFLLGNWCFKMQLLETFVKNCVRPAFLEQLQAARNLSKISLHFNKIPNSLRQVLQTYSEICIFCVLPKKSLSEAVSKYWSQSAREILWWNWWRCDEIHSTVNLGQK